MVATCPKPNNDYSLYSAFDNNPILHIDPLGDSLPTPKTPFAYDPKNQIPSQQSLPSEKRSWLNSNQSSTSDKIDDKVIDKPAGDKQSGSNTGSDEPSFGQTNTNKTENKKIDLIPTDLGDQIRLTCYEGVRTGKDGRIATHDVSTTKGKYDGDQ